MLKDRIKDFVMTNRVWFVFIPGFAGAHWVWWRVQCNEAFVTKEERKPFPFVILYRYLRDKMIGPKEIQNTKATGGG